MRIAGVVGVRMNRRRFLCAAGAGIAAQPFAGRVAPADSPWVLPGGRIRIGLLWSLTGHLSVIERPSRDVGLYWAERVNRFGGVAGLRIEPIVVDAGSDIDAYRRGCRHLIDEEGVLAVFGGYTSASRRAVMPLVTKRRSLFYYPTCYEGRECWQHIICTGPIANQHSRHLIPYMVSRYGPRALFVGSNYVWPIESNRNARTWLDEAGGELVEELYVPLGSADLEGAVQRIHQTAPDWVFSTLIGVSDVHFRRSYLRSGLTPDRTPTASLTTSEMEVAYMGTQYGEGHILSAPYFQSLDNPTNRAFVEDFLSSQHGFSGVTHYNMEETYLAFLYFAKALEALVTDLGEEAIAPETLRAYSAGLSLGADESPEGAVRIDPDNFNSWLTPKIGRFDSRGQIEVLLEQPGQIPPKPYLLYPHRGVCRSDGLHLPDGRVIKAAS